MVQRGLTSLLVIWAVSVGLAAPPARAEESTVVDPMPDSKPWAKGVSAPEQAAALAAFKTGNAFFSERRYALALKHYETAIGHWAHPAIHFNLTVCLIHMDRPIEAFEHVRHALVYEAAPLGEELFAQALTYRKLLNDRLGHLTVSVAQVGAEVTLDGKSLPSGTQTSDQLLMPGRHQLVVTLAGYVTHAEAIDLVAGEPLRVEPRLVPLSEATQYERRFATWIPWVTMTGGAVVGLAGLGLRAIAGAKLDAYDSAVAAECPEGCLMETLSPSAQDKRDQGRTLDRTSIATLSAGGAALTTALILLVINQPRAVERRIQLGTLLGPSQFGLSLRGRL